MSVQLMSVFHHKTGFHKLLNYFLCFSVMSTLMTIIDSQFYIIDSLSLDALLE